MWDASFRYNDLGVARGDSASGSQSSVIDPTAPYDSQTSLANDGLARDVAFSQEAQTNCVEIASGFLFDQTNRYDVHRDLCVFGPIE